MSKKALITGVTGQDGSYLTELLLGRGYEVHGIKRRSASPNEGRLQQIKNENFVLHYGDMTDATSLIKIIREVQPEEVYNLAAMSHVKTSFDVPEYTAQTDAIGVLRVLEAIRILGFAEKIKFYQASTSEMFSGKEHGQQNENTPFSPQSPYGAAKLYGYFITKIYRESYNMFACNGILFNHESFRRGENFVTRKITLAAAKISLGLQKKLQLGNLSAKRDWGHAKDYVEAMWLMLQQDKPDDYVVATGEAHSVREFCEIAFKKAGIELEWQGEGVEEKGIDKKTSKVIVEVNPKFFRPSEIEVLLGDATKAMEKMGWSPKISFEQLVEEMFQADLEKAKKELCLQKVDC